MSTRMVMGCCLVIFLLMGCGGGDKKAATTETEIPFEAPPKTPVSSTTDHSEFGELAEFDFSPRREKELLQKLNQSPSDTGVLIQLARLTQATTEAGPNECEGFKKSAAYLHRALKADPNVSESTDFRAIAGKIFYDESCALSLEKQAEESSKSLALALTNGWHDLDQLNQDEDLENLRKSPHFAAIEELIHAKREVITAAAIESLFAEKPNFKFEFELEDTEGQPLTKQSFAGKVLMVNIWGTWCGPCRAELPDLIAAYEKFKSEGFEIVGLNSEYETGESAVNLIKKAQLDLKINYRCALAGKEVLEQVPNLNGIPTSLFIDRQGRVRAKVVGMIDKLSLELIIQRMLKQFPKNAVEFSH